MDLQPKTEPASPPIPASSSNHGSLNEMSISELFSGLRTNCDKVEEVLLARDAKHKAEIDSLVVKYELEMLQRLHTEDQLKKKEQEYQNLERKWLDDNNSIAALRIRCSELEDENKKNLETIQKLKDENYRLEKEKINEDARVLNEMAVPDSPPFKRKKSIGHCIGESDINRLNEKWHIAGALDFERYRVLLPRRSSHTMSPPEVLLPFLKEAGFGDAIQLKDFIFDNTLISAFVERWRPETHTFHLSWGECTITLQDVAYHLGLRTDGEPVGGCMRDFQTWHQRSTWQWVEDLLGARPPMQSQGRKDGFAIKLAWLRERVQNIPAGAGDDTLRQYARCYILMLIGGYLMTDKSNNLVHIRWLPLLADFNRCRQMSWGSAVLAWTYHSLCRATHRNVTDITGCIPLLISWIYHRFPQWGPSDRDVATFPLAARLVGLGQQTRDHHEGRLLRWRHRLDTVCFDQFRWTPYDRPELQALCPDWLRSGHEIHTWRAVVPLVCFNFVEFHHIDRVKRQLGSDQQIPEDPVNVDKYLSTTARGDDVWWPEVLQEWYDRWRARHQPCHMITITPEPNPRLTQEYFNWWLERCCVRFLSVDDILADPRLTKLSNDVPPRHKATRGEDPLSESSDSASRCGVGRGRGGGGSGVSTS